MKYVLALLLVTAMPLAKHNYSIVNAGANCTTTCYELGNQRICNTHCW